MRPRNTEVNKMLQVSYHFVENPPGGRLIPTGNRVNQPNFLWFVTLIWPGDLGENRHEEELA